MSGTESILLSVLLKNFPYFQTAHMLYAKSLHNTNSVHYNNQLRVTAAYATDRKVLHRLITRQEIIEAFEPIESIEKTNKKIKAFNTNVDNVLQDSDIIVLKQNYDYLFWSILAVTTVIISMNIIKK